MSEWETQDVRLSIGDHDWRHVGAQTRWRMIQGDTMPGNCLAVTPSTVDPAMWSVTHRPTGMRLGKWSFSRDTARAVAVAVNAVGNWHRPIEEIANDGEMLRAAQQILVTVGGSPSQFLPPQWFVPDELTGIVRAVKVNA